MTEKHDFDTELENKLVKHYWVACLQPSTNRVDLSLVDGDSDFSIIPTNSRGKVCIDVGELRDIVKECVKQARIGYSKAKGSNP